MLDALLGSEELPEEFRNRNQVQHFSFMSVILLDPRSLTMFIITYLITRTSCAMTVREKALHPFIGYITSVRRVDPTIPK